MRFKERPSNMATRYSHAGIALSIWDYMPSTGVSTRSVDINELEMKGIGTERSLLIVVLISGWRSWFPCVRNIIRRDLSLFVHEHAVPLGTYACVIVERS